MDPISDLSLHFGDGNHLALRTAETVSVAAFRKYLESLSDASRFCRFLTPLSVSSLIEVSAITKCQTDRFVLLLENSAASEQTVIAELDCSYESVTNAIEFALSVSDAWQGHGVGTALVRWLEGRARKLCVARLYGDTFRSNGAVLALARNLGFLTLRHHADWQLLRCEKVISRPQRIEVSRALEDCAGPEVHSVMCRVATPGAVHRLALAGPSPVEIFSRVRAVRPVE